MLCLAELFVEFTFDTGIIPLFVKSLVELLLDATAGMVGGLKSTFSGSLKPCCSISFFKMKLLLIKPSEALCVNCCWLLVLDIWLVDDNDTNDDCGFKTLGDGTAV